MSDQHGGGLAGLSSTGSTSSGGLTERFKQNPLGVIGTALQSFIEGAQGKPISAVGREADKSKREFERRRLAVLESGEARRGRKEERDIITDEADREARARDAQREEAALVLRLSELPDPQLEAFRKQSEDRGDKRTAAIAKGLLSNPEDRKRLREVNRKLTEKVVSPDEFKAIDQACELEVPFNEHNTCMLGKTETLLKQKKQEKRTQFDTLLDLQAQAAGLTDLVKNEQIKKLSKEDAQKLADALSTPSLLELLRGGLDRRKKNKEDGKPVDEGEDKVFDDDDPTFGDTLETLTDSLTEMLGKVFFGK